MENLMKMMRYQTLRDGIAWAVMAIMVLFGFFMADGYLDNVMGQADRAAKSLDDVFGGMVYDSTFLLVILSALLALRVGQAFSGRTIDLLVSAGHRRSAIYTTLVLNNLLVFNLAALLYPCVGTLRELGHFAGHLDAAAFVVIAKVALYALLLNSAVFLLVIALSIWLRAALPAMAVAALGVFALALYMGYGMMMNLPVAFLPIAQVRFVAEEGGLLQQGALLVGAIWSVVGVFLGWVGFRRCDLK